MRWSMARLSPVIGFLAKYFFSLIKFGMASLSQERSNSSSISFYNKLSKFLIKLSKYIKVGRPKQSFFKDGDDSLFGFGRADESDLLFSDEKIEISREFKLCDI